jgi:hypothetical protein
MQTTLKHSLAHQTQILTLNGLSLDFSIRHSNGWRVRSLKALRKGISDLQKIGDALPDLSEPIPLVTRYKICDCISIISGYAQLFLDQCAVELNDDARLYLKMTLVMMQYLEEVSMRRKRHSFTRKSHKTAKLVK